MWTHGCLHGNYTDILKSITFIVQASRCVHTRDVTPAHTIKNLAVFTFAVGVEPAIRQVYNIYGNLVENKEPGESILVEVASHLANPLLQQLNDFVAELPMDISWAIHSRSRGSSTEQNMYTIVGSMHTYTDMHTIGMIHAIKANYEKISPGGKLYIGRRKMFADPRAIIATGNIHHILHMYNLFEEAVVISPHKALFIPCATAKEFNAALSSSPELRKCTLRYRKSGPFGQRNDLQFARPADLAANLRAEKLTALAARLPDSQGTLLRTQINIEILGIEGSNYEHIPKIMLDEICKILNGSLTETVDQIKRLEEGEWRKDLRAGSWSGRCTIQLRNLNDGNTVFDHVDGRTICIGGILRTISVTSPCNAQLGNRSLRNASSSSSNG